MGADRVLSSDIDWIFDGDLLARSERKVRRQKETDSDCIYMCCTDSAAADIQTVFLQTCVSLTISM